MADIIQTSTIKAKKLHLENHPEYDGHENVVMFIDDATGLKAIIAVHDTTMGPSLGGCRFWPYDNDEDAITDVLRLSRGMTYKSALAGLARGGGKSVIIGDPKNFDTEARSKLMTAMGKAVHSLAGRYIIAEDMNTNEQDMEAMAKVTPHVGGLPPKAGSALGGNPSPVTALGVFSGVRATAKALNGHDDLTGMTISVQGLGSVGMTLCEHLHKAGAKMIVTDINQAAIDEAVTRFGATAVGLDEIYSVEVDIFAPCARGAILNDATIPQLNVKGIAGAANNQLGRIEEHSRMLEKKGILYAPDYVVNAGGVIFVAGEVLGAESYDSVMQHVTGIYETTIRIFEDSKRKNITPALAADELAQEIIAAKKLKTTMAVA
jgi:leucine dehydrogenase